MFSSKFLILQIRVELSSILALYPVSYYSPHPPPHPPLTIPTVTILSPPLLSTAPADMDTYVYDHRGLKVRKSSLSSSSSSPVSPVHTRSLSSNTATTTTGRVIDTPPSVAWIIVPYHSPHMSMMVMDTFSGSMHIPTS